MEPTKGSLVLVNMFCGNGHDRINQVGIVTHVYNWNPYKGVDYNYEVRLQDGKTPCYDSEVEILPPPFLPSVCF